MAVLTGNQLKDTEYIYRHRATGKSVERGGKTAPDLEALRRTLLEKLFAVSVESS